MNRIKELRKEYDETLISLRDKVNNILKSKNILVKGKLLQVTDSQLSFYENGKRSPRNDEVWVALAEVFGVSLSYIMGLSNNKNIIEEGPERIDDNYGNLDLVTDFLIFLTDYNFLISDKDISTILELLKSLSLNHNSIVDDKRKDDILFSSGKYTLMYALNILRHDEEDDESGFTGYGYDRDEIYDLLKHTLDHFKKQAD
ncbi:helix-turn-helix domain-containing protein [Lactococcus garvieae]|uniref:helix-turn-helix domain-containing protein n=1 Tax=Lactococcus garvieae TaxID=1363 RepID=UPI001F623C71|nr:helix-turn-helix transcriptional regulator [Lactococcus garvieae]MCI3861094.1 helix-turn-helix domain-containing protein [Lactococcus garvieae]